MVLMLAGTFSVVEHSERMWEKAVALDQIHFLCFRKAGEAHWVPPGKQGCGAA
jgi:hypothetical protein